MKTTLRAGTEALTRLEVVVLLTVLSALGWFAFGVWSAAGDMARTYP